MTAITTVNGKTIPVFMSNKELKEHLNAIEYNMTKLKEANDSLVEKNTALKDEHYKDKELQQMHDKLNKAIGDLNRGFPLSLEEADLIENWKDQHMTNIHKASTVEQRMKLNGVSGGRWTYVFTPTGIGTFASCRCNTCYAKALDAYNHSTNTELRDYIKKYDAAIEWDDC